MACNQHGTTPREKYISRKQQLQQLKGNEKIIETIRYQCNLLTDFFDTLQITEQYLHQEELDQGLDCLRYSLCLLAEHLKKILG